MSRFTSTIRWASYAVIAVSLVVLIRALPFGTGIAELRSWAGGLGVWGPIAFGLVYVAAVVAMAPASLLTLAAGATFGLLVGTVTVSLASTIGAALALLIGRYLARGKVEELVRRRPRFAAVDRAIEEGGWKIVALLRLSPAIPFNVQNYLYGLTSIRFWTCVLTSWIAMLPGTFLYVYLGHAAGSVAATGEKSPAEWGLLGVGLLATVAVTVYVTRLAQRTLREQTQLTEAEPQRTSASTDDTAAVEEMAARPTSPTRTIVAAMLAVVLAALAAVTQFSPGLTSQWIRRILPLGPPPVELTEAYSEQSGGTTFDHSTFDALLKQHVDDDGWVDYASLRNDAARLDAYLDALAAAPFDDLGRNEKLALLINAYNACTLRLILDHWPLESIKDVPASERWDAVRWNVGGHTWSLNQIEHEQIRPNFKEPRIHFALVCAAVGCPPLRNEAFAADRLETQLEDQAAYIHAHDTWMQFDVEHNIVKLTPLYDWYAGDFEQSAGSKLHFVAGYDAEVRGGIEAGSPLKTLWLPYDWSINDVSNRQPR